MRAPRLPVARSSDLAGTAAGGFDDGGLFADYNHYSQNWSWFAGYQDLGRDFRADSGFVPRVDVRRLERQLRPRLARPGGPLVLADRCRRAGLRIEDHDGRLTDQEASVRR